MHIPRLTNHKKKEKKNMEENDFQRANFLLMEYVISDNTFYIKSVHHTF